MGYFTSDIDRCDQHFWGCFEWVSHTVIDCVTKVAIATYFSPILGLFVLCNFYILYKYSAYTKQAKHEVGRIRHKMHTRMKTHLSQSTEGMSVVRAFQREDLIQNKTVDLINDTNKSDIVIRGAHEYFHQRLRFLSNFMYIFVGIVCIHLRGTLEPIYIAMMFQYLEGISHSMNSLMHGYREIEENLRSLQKLLKLEDIKQEKDVVEDLETIEVPE